MTWWSVRVRRAQTYRDPKDRSQNLQEGCNSNMSVWGMKRKEGGECLHLPSSHGGGVLPGNQRGLSGAAAADTESSRRAVCARAARFPCLSFLPPRNDALVAAMAAAPFFWDLKQIHRRTAWKIWTFLHNMMKNLPGDCSNCRRGSTKRCHDGSSTASATGGSERSRTGGTRLMLGRRSGLILER